MRYVVLCTLGIAVGAMVAYPSDAAVLCRKPSGAVVARDAACKRKETALDLRQFGGGSDPGGDGGPSDGTTDHASGSRLRVRYLAGADGSREVVGFFDSQRNENCFFGGSTVRASDGTIRCLPSETIAYQSSFYFQDAACTARLAAALKSQCPPKYAARYSASQCPLTEMIYPILSAFTPGATIYYVNASAQCVAYPGSLTSYDFYTVGDEIPPASFVEATVLTVVSVPEEVTR